MAYNTKSIEGGFVWGIEVLCYCAVNIYAIITGYLSFSTSNFDKKYASSIIKRYIQVWFYSFVITIIIHMLRPEMVGWGSVAKACLPIIFKQYWYYTAYFLVAVFCKYINKFIAGMEKKEMCVFLVLATLFLSVFPTIRRGDVFGENNGYSALWIAYMYFLGAIMRKSKIVDNISRKLALSALGLSWGIAFLSKILLTFISEKNSMFLVSYVSPLIIIEAVSLFVTFCKLPFRPQNEKILLGISSSTFGIYLIHSNISLTLTYFNGFFKHETIITMFFSAIAIFVLCICIELFRKKLFDILKVEKAVLKIYVFFERKAKSLKKNISLHVLNN